ncbi:MAG TPA: HEPN domain-containing protein [Gemmataceae bacterium]
MPSNAFTVHLNQLLRDADELDDAHSRLRTGTPGRQYGLAALNRAAVVMCVSAWEAYVEELVRESVLAMRPAAAPFGAWSAHNAAVLGQLGRFNNPNVENVRTLLSDAIGLRDVQQSWAWRNCTSDQAVQRLAVAMRLRHQIAHGVNPRPVIHNQYSSQLPEFFRRLGRATDQAVRNHLVSVIGIAHPRPL